ncbi:MAG: sigma-70 family RNA polymerase sigma factor [Deltaproteobacteria bacterium]|nr:sigma-70 family RNA polymerase sigma factor [Deltaproteobacteria bacterium]
MSAWYAIFPRPSPEAVVREHAPMVHRQLRRIFGPQADIDDVFQSVFVEVLRSLPTFAGRARLSTWIRRITWNVAYQEMRLQYRQPKTTAIEDADLALGKTNVAEGKAADQQCMRKLYAALDRLDPKERVAVVMHDIEGCTLKEIARSQGRPLQTIASQLYAGRARIAAHLQGDVLFDLQPGKTVAGTSGPLKGSTP